MSDKKIKIGLVGFGTVGSGVAKILLEDNDMIKEKTGLNLELAKIVDLDTKTKRPVELPEGVLTDDISAILDDDSIEIGIELIGGTGFAKDLIIKMLKAGKHVVTANKALLAKHGIELYQIARENNRCIAFEASCAGGIPIVSAIRTGLVANRIEKIYGILNGTCNYILSSMAAKNEDFPVALKQAQEKGYAEADPTLDINGGDSGHKLAILASIAFGNEIEFDDVSVDGIEQISIQDIQCGSEMGYVLKLLGIAERDTDGMISLRVTPAFINKDHALAQVNGPFNAVSVFGSSVGQTMYFGRGAGMLPTASAVVADAIEVGLGNSQRIFDSLKLKSKAQTSQYLKDTDEIESRYYIRLLAADRPGVFCKVAQVLADNGISISGALQHEGTGPENTVPVIFTTHKTKQANIAKAIEIIGDLDVVALKPVSIQIIDIPEDKD